MPNDDINKLKAKKILVTLPIIKYFTIFKRFVGLKSCYSPRKFWFLSEVNIESEFVLTSISFLFGI